MAITLGTEISLPLHMDDSTTTYGDLETALTDAGFTNYTIMRTVNFDGTIDAQLYVRSDWNTDGSQDPLPAGTTMDMLTTAVQALETAQAPA